VSRKSKPGHILVLVSVRMQPNPVKCCNCGRFSQLRILLGDFQFAELQRANCILGPAYFVLYVFFIFFILLNMFLAIVIDAYSEVKAKMSRHKHDFEMIHFFKKVKSSSEITIQ